MRTEIKLCSNSAFPATCTSFPCPSCTLPGPSSGSERLGGAGWVRIHRCMGGPSANAGQLPGTPLCL